MQSQTPHDTPWTDDEVTTIVLLHAVYVFMYVATLALFGAILGLVFWRVFFGSLVLVIALRQIARLRATERVCQWHDETFPGSAPLTPLGRASEAKQNR